MSDYEVEVDLYTPEGNGIGRAGAVFVRSLEGDTTWQGVLVEPGGFYNRDLVRWFREARPGDTVLFTRHGLNERIEATVTEIPQPGVTVLITCTTGWP